MFQTFHHKNCMDGTSTHEVSGHCKPSLKNSEILGYTWTFT